MDDYIYLSARIVFFKYLFPGCESASFCLSVLLGLIGRSRKWRGEGLKSVVNKKEGHKKMKGKRKKCAFPIAAPPFHHPFVGKRRYNKTKAERLRKSDSKTLCKREGERERERERAGQREGQREREMQTE